MEESPFFAGLLLVGGGWGGEGALGGVCHCLIWLLLLLLLLLLFSFFSSSSFSFSPWWC